MDLQDFKSGKMYFEEELSNDVDLLLEMAASSYASGNTELFLLKAYFLEPSSFTVVVALYRYYFYQHNHQDALKTAFKAMQLAANRIELTESWQKLSIKDLGYAVMRSMELVRFYLLALKGAGYLNLRLGAIEEGVSMLEKVSELDCEDRLGAGALLNSIRNDWQDNDEPADEQQLSVG
jgi:tetratricopeptide (TPR) repeat protein